MADVNTANRIIVMQHINIINPTDIPESVIAYDNKRPRPDIIAKGNEKKATSKLLRRKRFNIVSFLKKCNKAETNPEATNIVHITTDTALINSNKFM